MSVELANRCLVLAVDEDRGQTRAIHAAQRQAHTLTGVLAEAERRRIVKVHQDAQRLLQSVLVVNPYAPQLGFADERTRSRRDHAKYLNLIRAVALVHQHQRPRRTALTPLGEEVVYIEVTPADIAVANRLAHDVLGRSLDELAPQTRRLLELINKLVGERCAAEGVGRPDVRFWRREVRGFCGWSDFQVRTHLGRLVELEYVLVHRGGRGQSFVYELLYDGGGTDGGPHLCGLVDPATLTPCGYDTDRAAATAPIEPPPSTQRAPGEDGSRVPGNGRRPASTDVDGASGPAGRGTGGAGSGVIPAGDG